MSTMQGYLEYKEELKAEQSDWKKSLERGAIRNWWVIVAILLILLAYEQGKRFVYEDALYLSERLQELQTEKEQLTRQERRQHLIIQSGSDPKWIELTLMRRLSLVPEGMKKVYFKK